MAHPPVPSGIPVLGRGRHRTPRKGACFMELASVLAGERWSDHPACTHPLLGQLAREVNDRIGDAARQELASLVPSVVGQRGDGRTWVALPVAVAAATILDVPEPTQRVLAAGLQRAEQLCAEAGPELAGTCREARAALALVPGAVAWAGRRERRRRIDPTTFTERCAPAMVRYAVEGVCATGSPDRDRRLRALLEAGIAACPAPEPVAAPPAPAPRRRLRG